MPKLTLCFKGHFIGLHNLSTSAVTIGRAPDAGIHIDSLAVAERHALLTLEQEQCHVSPIDDHEVRVNRRPVVGPTLLCHGDIIQIGKHELFFSDDTMGLNPALTQNLRPIGQPQDRAGKDTLEQLISSIDTLPSGTIQIQSGRHLGKIIPLQRGLTRLGFTGNECAVIAHRDDGYYISHLEGDNPPLVNNQSIGDSSVRLQEGDEILLDGTRMRFHDRIEQSAAI